MSKVVYLLGAGASYGKRDINEPTNSINRIVEGLPIVNEISNEIDVVINELGNLKSESTEVYNWQGEKRDFKFMLNVIIDGLRWLKNEASNHATIDTFAKKIYLKDDRISYGKLKFFLTSFFLIEQSIHGIDKRYDTFFANILDSNLNIPNDIFIMTWNYDNQLDIAYRDYCNKPLSIYNPVEPQNDGHAKVFKINGSANCYNINQIDASIHTKESLTTLLDKICNQACIANEDKKEWSSGVIDLLFAWEKDFLKKHSEKLFNNISDTEILIIIGYTFPFFNRDTDKMIFENMPNLKQIYIQDPLAEDVRDFLYSALTEVQRKQLIPSVKLVKNTTNFFLPPEL